jgi:hypothetical protein
LQTQQQTQLQDKTQTQQRLQDGDCGGDQLRLRKRDNSCTDAAIESLTAADADDPLRLRDGYGVSDDPNGEGIFIQQRDGRSWPQP